MLYIENRNEIDKYKKIERRIFNKDDHMDPFKNEYRFKSVFSFEDIGEKIFFNYLKKRFKNTSPKFCISTIFEDEPIFVFNLSLDMVTDYLNLMHFPAGLGITFPDVGLSIINERIFAFSINADWGFYADRYEDKLVVFSNIEDKMSELLLSD